MPYSRQQRITGAALISNPVPILEGEPLGSRKPWNFRGDLQIDRNISFEQFAVYQQKKILLW